MLETAVKPNPMLYTIYFYVDPDKLLVHICRIKNQVFFICLVLAG